MATLHYIRTLGSMLITK